MQEEVAHLRQHDDHRHNIGWSRLNVRIEHRHGYHNNGETEDAELCQPCAIFLLEDALEKVKAGVRATQGSHSSYEEKWEKR